MSRAKRSSWNFLSTLGMSVVTLVIGLAATRFLERWLGKERFGAYRAVSDWGGYLTLLEVGLGGALLPMVASAINRGDSTELGGAMASGFHGYRVIAFFNLLAGAMLVLLIPRLVTTSPGLVGELRLAAAIIAASAIMLPLAPLRQIWEADQRTYVITAILLVQSLVITGSSVLFARIGWGVPGQALAALIGLSIYYFALSFHTLRSHRDIFRWFFTPATPEGRAALWALNWPTLTMSISGRLSLLTDNIVIAHFLGSAAVVPFFITQRLPQIALSQLQAVGNSTWAGMLHLLETEGQAAFNNRLLELTQLIVVLGLSAVVPIVAFNAEFVELWMPGRGLYAGLMLTVLASINAIFLSVISFWGWMFTGTGRNGKLMGVNIISTLVNISVSVGATVWLKSARPEFYLIGPVLGTTIAFVTCTSWWFPLLLRQSFGTPFTSTIISLTRPLLVALPLTAGFLMISRAHPARSWALLIIEMGFAGTLNLVLSWAVVLSKAQRQVWTERVMRGIPLLNRQAKAALVVADAAAVTGKPIEPS